MDRLVTAMLAIGDLAAWPLSQAQTASPESKPQPTAIDKPDEALRPAPSRASAGPDPRVCLELTTNLEIHVCAEKYRPHRRAS